MLSSYQFHKEREGSRLIIAFHPVHKTYLASNSLVADSCTFPCWREVGYPFLGPSMTGLFVIVIKNWFWKKFNIVFLLNILRSKYYHSHSNTRNQINLQIIVDSLETNIKKILHLESQCVWLFNRFWLRGGAIDMRATHTPQDGINMFGRPRICSFYLLAAE
jgi:hypothetical protein